MTEHHLEFLNLKEGCTGSSRSTLPKYHIVGNHIMSRLKWCSLSYIESHGDASFGVTEENRNDEISYKKKLIRLSEPRENMLYTEACHKKGRVCPHG